MEITLKKFAKPENNKLTEQYRILLYNDEVGWIGYKLNKSKVAFIDFDVEDEYKARGIVKEAWLKLEDILYDKNVKMIVWKLDMSKKSFGRWLYNRIYYKKGKHKKKEYYYKWLKGEEDIPKKELLKENKKIKYVKPNLKRMLKQIIIEENLNKDCIPDFINIEKWYVSELNRTNKTFDLLNLQSRLNNRIKEVIDDYKN